MLILLCQSPSSSTQFSLSFTVCHRPPLTATTIFIEDPWIRSASPTEGQPCRCSPLLGACRPHATFCLSELCHAIVTSLVRPCCLRFELKVPFQHGSKSPRVKVTKGFHFLTVFTPLRWFLAVFINNGQWKSYFIH